jgi:dTDP-4-amino-4,6-dideoxygalactose transaminase
MRVPITKVLYDEADLEAVQGPLRTGWVVQGPNVEAFERSFAEFTGADSAIACTSCTTGLHLGLAALGIGPGDEVIVPSLTWVATANAVEYCGATPVFCDVELETFNIDTAQLPGLITERTRAIMPVHLFGLSADMGAVMRLAEAHDLGVVEDAACGLGALWADAHVGTIGDFGAFSFHPRKAVSTGEGGMVLCRSAEMDKKVRSLRDHGASKSDLARHHDKAAFLLSEFNHLGFNYRMTDIQGALGVTQMQKAGYVLERRRALAGRYDEILADLDWLITPVVPEPCVHAYQSYVCRFAPEPPTLENVDALHERRNAMMMAMEADGVSTRQGTHAVTNLGYYTEKYDIDPRDYPGGLLSELLTVTLPLYPQMTEVEQDYVVECLRKHFR